MATSFADRSSDVNRDVRDVVRTETTTVVDQFYAARSLWIDADTPPQRGTTRSWTNPTSPA